MKKIVIFVLFAALLLSLAACGGKSAGDTAKAPSSDEKKPAQSVISAPPLTETEIEKLAGQGFEKVKSAGQSGKTTEELIAALYDVDAVMASFGGASETTTDAEPVIQNPDAASQGETVVFSDEPWEEKGFEVADWKSEMSAEDLAALEEMNSTDWDAMMAETEASMEDFENMDAGEMAEGESGELPDLSGIEIPDVGPIEIPEGYEQYLPEGFDPNNPLAGIDIGSLLH